ncbi:MAG: hypothetical protein JWN66_4952 [Sphingomonas bacterium]|uniref:hypothetical protein n=1 Tax=Sphingomonas bacterium TaxID=1895847 RepID=UPI00262DD75E|nr:hypothetical protein [Sphingomonas bacterium]MDB5707836.1 hypothetical protein [Sphingomonas bacterium]
MTDTEQRAPVEAIQADIDEADACYNAISSIHSRANCHFDHREYLAPIFARHRLAFSQHPATGGEGEAFPMPITVRGREYQVDSLSELLRLINGGARIDSLGVHAADPQWDEPSSALTPIPDGEGERVLCQFCRGKYDRLSRETSGAVRCLHCDSGALSPPPEGVREEIARALYEHWVAEDFDNEYAPWELLGDKATWLARAEAILSIRGVGE